MLYTIKFLSHRVREAAIKQLESEGIESRVTFPPIHRQPQLGNEYLSTKLPVTESICRRVLSLPIFYLMTNQMQNTVIGALVRALR